MKYERSGDAMAVVRGGGCGNWALGIRDRHGQRRTDPATRARTRDDVHVRRLGRHGDGRDPARWARGTDHHSGAGAATLTGSMEGECHGRYQPWTRICAGGKYVHHVAGADQIQ